MKKFALTLIILFILGFAPYYLYQNKIAQAEQMDYFSTWKSFIPRSGLFQVSLPSTPQYGKDFVLIPNTDQKKRYDMYASEKLDGTLFLINVITYPAEFDTSSSNDILRQNIEELMHNKTDNSVNNMIQSMMQGRSSLDFNFENKEFRVEGKSLHDDHLVYILTYIAKKESFDSQEFDFFIGSFKILKSSKDAIKSKGLIQAP